MSRGLWGFIYKPLALVTASVTRLQIHVTAGVRATRDLSSPRATYDVREHGPLVSKVSKGWCVQHGSARKHVVIVWRHSVVRRYRN